MTLFKLRFCVELAVDDGKDSTTIVVFDKEMTKLTQQEAGVLALEEILFLLAYTFYIWLAFHCRVL